MTDKKFTGEEWELLSPEEQKKKLKKKRFSDKKAVYVRSVPGILNPVKKRFADEYIKLGNAAEAADRVYSLKNRNMSKIIGAKLVRDDDEVKTYIRQAMAEVDVAATAKSVQEIAINPNEAARDRIAAANVIFKLAAQLDKQTQQFREWMVGAGIKPALPEPNFNPAQLSKEVKRWFEMFILKHKQYPEKAAFAAQFGRDPKGEELKLTLEGSIIDVDPV